MKGKFLYHCHYWYLEREFDEKEIKSLFVIFPKPKILLQQEKRYQGSFKPWKHF